MRRQVFESQIATACLNASGWYLGRSVDISPSLEWFEKTGFPPPSQAAQAFLREFGGLRIRRVETPRRGSPNVGFSKPARTSALNWFRRMIRAPKRVDLGYLLEIDPVGNNYDDVEAVQVIERTIGHVIHPAGIDEKCADFFLGESGQLFEQYGGILTQYGVDADSAIVALCERREGPSWQIDFRSPGQLELASKMLEPATLEILSAAILERGAEFEPMVYDELRTKNGRGPSNVVLDFLRRFGGIRIDRPNWDKSTTTYTFDPRDALKVTDFHSRTHFDYLTELSFRYQLGPLFPIAIVYDSGPSTSLSILLMNDAGAVYEAISGVWTWLSLVGENPEQALNVLVRGLQVRNL